jgi:vacuolar protein sorting-associated protein 13A/C
MVQSLVTHFAKKYLAEYIEDFSSDMLSISLGKGRIELNELVLKGSALAALDLPVDVKWGKVGTLTLSLSWTSLWKAPIRVVVNDL